MAHVELIYFHGCPNVALARQRLLQAFVSAGIAPRWQEWERSDPASPAHVRNYGSPTILVDGRDVTGMEPLSDDAGACRVYANGSSAMDGAPGAGAVAAALRGTEASAPARGGWRGSFAAVPAIGAVALPKLTCPACWPAYSAVLGSMGVPFVNYTPYLFPLTAAFLLLSLAALAWRAPQRRGYGPVALALAASVAILAGKFAFDSNAAMYAGMAVLIAASVWNAWPRSRPPAAGNCPACAPTVTEP